MGRINILHLTDIHFGQTFLESSWRNVEKALWDDLDFVTREVGPPDAIIFTGDIAFSGQPDQFERGTRFLASLREKLFEEYRVYPSLFVVPGNHDLVRPDPNDSGLLVLTDLERIDLLDESYAIPRNTIYRKLIESAFENYNAWCDSSNLERSSILTGALPGDFATRMDSDGINIGILGLNTTFLQLRAGDFNGRLMLLPHQVDRLAGLIAEHEFEENDINILVSHQPITWLSPSSRNHLEETLFPERNKLFVHLFGHMHESNLTGASKGGGQVRYYSQGKSLCGLETWGEESHQKRLHGYSVMTLEKRTRGLSLFITPRSAINQVGRGWVFDKDLSGSFALPRDSISTRPLLLNEFLQPVEQETDRSSLSGVMVPSQVVKTPTRRARIENEEPEGYSTLHSIAHLANKLRSEPESIRWERREFASDVLSNTLECIQEVLKPEVELTHAESLLINCLVYLSDLVLHQAFAQYNSLAELASDSGLQREYLSITNGYERLVQRAISLRTESSEVNASADIESWLIQRSLLHSDFPWTRPGVFEIAREFAHTLEKRKNHVDSLATELIRLAREIVTLRSSSEKATTNDNLLMQGLALDMPNSPSFIRRSVTMSIAKAAWHMTLLPVSCGKEILEQVGTVPEFSLDEVLNDLAESTWYRTNDNLPLFHCACSDPAAEVAALFHIENLKTILPLELDDTETGSLLKSRVVARLAHYGVRPRQTVDGKRVYETPITRITMSYEPVRELIMGKRLYGDERLAIREMYQNSLDACRYRQLREHYLALVRGEDPERVSWQGDIEFALKSTDDNRLQIECRDNGVGMDRKQIGGLFLSAGERFTESLEFSTEQASWYSVDPSLKLAPNSTFGIGVFSYFMLADRVDVITRRQNSDGTLGECLRLAIFSGSSIARIYRASNALLPNGGTIVQMTLRSEFDDETRVGLRQTLLDLVLYCPFNLLVSDLRDKSKWDAGVISREVGGNPAVAFSENETHIWWVENDGKLLADGIRTPESTFGFVASLHGDHKPTLQTDRNQVVAWDEAWVLERLSSSGSTLVEWPGLSLSWLWRFSERYPRAAVRLVNDLISLRPIIPLGQSKLWEREVDLRMVGCFPADRYLVKPLVESHRFPTEYSPISLPPEKEPSSNRPSMAFPSCLGPWRRAVWLEALPELFQDEEELPVYAFKLFGDGRPVLAPQSIEHLHIPDPIDASLIASEQTWPRAFFGELGRTSDVDIVALIRGAYTSQISMGEAVNRLERLGQFGLRSVPTGIGTDFSDYVPSVRDVRILRSMGERLSLSKEIDKVLFLELLPLSRLERIGVGELAAQALWLLSNLGMQVAELKPVPNRLWHHVPNNREVRFFGFDRYGAKVRNEHISRAKVLQALDRAGIRDKRDLSDLLENYDWLELNSILDKLENVSFDDQDEVSLQAWSSNFDRRPPWVDADVFRRGYFSDAHPDQRELIGHAIFWSVLNGESLRVAIRRIWMFPGGLEPGAPNLDLISDESADQMDLRLLQKRFGSVKKFGSAQFEGISSGDLMLREIMPIELLEAQSATKVGMKEIFSRLEKFRFAGVLLPDCDPQVLGRARLTEMQRRLMLTDKPNPEYERFPHPDRPKEIPFIGPITRPYLFEFAYDQRITLGKAFKIVESTVPFGMKHSCHGIDQSLASLEPTDLDISISSHMDVEGVGLGILLSSYELRNSVSEVIDRLQVWLPWLLELNRHLLEPGLEAVKSALNGEIATIDDCIQFAAARAIGRTDSNGLKSKHIRELSAEANASLRDMKQNLRRFATLFQLDGVNVQVLEEGSDRPQKAISC